MENQRPHTDKLPLPTLAKFLEHPGQSTSPIRQWMDIFDNYLIIADANRTTPLTSLEKNALLYMHLGVEGCRIFQANPVYKDKAMTTWGNFREAVIKQFQIPTNKVKAEFEFMNRRQESSETFDEFLTAIRHMASDCDFGETYNRRVAMQLIFGTRDSKGRQLCLRMEEINLDEAIRTFQMEELADTTVRTLEGQQMVHRVGRTQPPNKPQKSRQGPPRKNQTRHNGPDGSRKSCMGCGNTNHKWRDEDCPARGQLCNFCNAPDHFEKVCRKRQQQKPHNKRVHNTAGGQDKKTLGTFQVYNGRRFTTLTIEADSGADSTIIPETLYCNMFKNIPLEPAPTQVLNYDQHPIQIIGHFKTTVAAFGKHYEDYVHVTNEPLDSIIGKNFLHPLNILVDCGNYNIRDGGPMRLKTIQTTSATTGDWKESIIPTQYPGLLEEKLGTFPDFQHRIRIDPSAKPTVTGLRSVPLARREAVKEEVQLMEDQDIWEKVSESDWIHGMVTVPKGDGSVRITTDLSPLNVHVKPDNHPIPNVKDLFLELANAKYFSKIDLRKGYFHIKLHPDSRKYTTTTTAAGLYQYKRLPMGLKDSAQCFQRAVAKTLAGIPGVIAYIDDILIFAATKEEHDRILHQVLERLNSKNFRLNLVKCSFRVTIVHFLGHIIEGGKVYPDPKNVDPIRNVREPQSKKDVQSFLGMINYYADFLEDVSSIAEPLRALTRKDTNFNWSEECRLSFQTLKAMACDKLSLNIFDPNVPTIVTTDASNAGIGAVLSQIQNRREVPIAFASHTLSPTERRYAANEREALACVWALEYWEKFLLGRHFLLRTDHMALKRLLTSHKTKRESAKFYRWQERLSAFDYKVAYHPGNQNHVADALSRLKQRAANYGIRMNNQAITRDLLVNETKVDTILQEVISFLDRHWPKQAAMKQDIRNFFQIRNQLTYQHGLLFKQSRIVAPSSLHKTILSLAHIGHPGIVRMKRKMRETYWWRGLDRQVEEYVRNCGPCQSSDKSTAKSKVPTTPIPIPSKPGLHYGLDITGPFYNDYSIVVLIDYYSSFPEILITKNTMSRIIIPWLNELFGRYGLPDRITTDNGPQFVSEQFETFLAQRDILHIKTAIYSPQENGLVEAFNKPLKYTVQALTAEEVPFRQGVMDFLAQFRSTPPTPDGISPAEKFLGHPIRLRFQPRQKDTSESTTLGAHDRPEKPPAAQEPRQLIRHSLFKKGEMVIVKMPHVRKGQPPYSKPMTVTQVLGFFTYILSDGKKHNARRLKPWRQEDSESHPTQEDTPATLPSPQGPRRSQRRNKGRIPQRFDPCRDEAGGRH